MSKLIKNAYNAGEMSQHFDGRTDLNKYYNGASKLINGLVLPHGGFTKRPGTIYKSTSPSRANLTPFEFSVGDALILEWTNALLRFYKDQAIVNRGAGTEDISGLDNVIAHWLLNEITGTTVADADGGTHDGTATADTSALTATGLVGAGCFDLDCQYTVEITDHNDFTFSTADLNDDPFSIVCWGYVTLRGGLQVLLSKWRDDSTAGEWRFSLDNAQKLQLHLVDSSTNFEAIRIAQWKLNEDAASKTVLDEDATSHDGLTQVDNTADLTATGKINKCLDFGGADAVVITNDHDELSFGDGSDDSDFSIAGWIYYTSHASFQTIIAKWGASKEWQFGVQSDGTITLAVYDESANAQQYRRTNDPLTEGWHFIVATYDDSVGADADAADRITIYVDSASVAVTSFGSGTYVSMENSAEKVVIGAGNSASLTLYWQDKIDNVMLFSAILSMSQILSLYNSGNGTENMAGVEVFAISDDVLTTGWHLLGCSYSAPADEATAASGIILYVDGVAVASTATNSADYTAMQNGAEEVRIGSQRNSGDTDNENYWSDKIDEVSIYGDVLTPTEMASLYSITPYSIVSPYTTAQSFGIHYTQSADVMYIAHNDVFPKKLSRNDTLDWTIVDVPFKGGAFLIENTTSASLVGFARTGGTARSAYYFLTGTTGTLTATAHSPFNINMVGALWLVKHTRDVDNDTDTFAKDTNVVPTLETYASGAIFIKGNATVSFEPIATGKMSQLWRKAENGNWQTFRSFRGAAAFSWTENEDNVLYAMTRSDSTINGTLTAKEAINYGIVKITAFTSSTVVTAEVVDKVLSNNTNDNAVTTSMWAEGAWSTYRGFPRTVGFHEDRLWWASTTNDPDKLWASQSGLYEDMSFTNIGADNEAVTPIIKDNEVSQIQWFMSRKVMAIGAANREYSLTAQNPDDPITPLDKKSTPQTGFSSSNIQPVMLNDSIFFLQRQGKKLGAMKFDSVTENFIVDDATLLAYGLLDSAPTNMAVSRSPDSLIWVVRTDGVLPTFTYDPKEEVSGWGRQIFGNSVAVETPTGYVESVAVIPGASEDEIWVNVRRTIDTTEVFYTELFSPRAWGSDIEDAIFGIDSVVTYDDDASSAMTGGLHLKGETVSVFADGEVFDDAVVSATGTFTLKKATVTTTAKVVQYGLPYTMKVRSMRLAVPQAPHALQTKIKRVTSVTTRYIRSLLGSAGTEIGGTEFLTDIEATYSTDSADTPVNNRGTQGGFNEDAYTVILSDDPVPFTALAAITEVEI